jgi:hypothetical protein
MRPTPNARRPAKSILDPAFRYKPSHATNVRETFERVRRELAQACTANVVRMPLKEPR